MRVPRDMIRLVAIVFLYASNVLLRTDAESCEVGHRTWSRYLIQDEMFPAICALPRICLKGKLSLIFANDKGKVCAMQLGFTRGFNNIRRTLRGS